MEPVEKISVTLNTKAKDQSRPALIPLWLVALAVWMFLAAPRGRAVTAPAGPDRLRELAVFPTLTLQLSPKIQFYGRQWWVGTQESLVDDISAMRDEVKSNPKDVEKSLRLMFLLDNAGQTNEAQELSARVVALCRARQTDNPASLLQMAEALDDAGETAAAENAYRQAVSISSNDWRCWMGLGCYLEHFAWWSLTQGELTSTHRPSPSAMEKSDSLDKEAAACIERALKLGGNSAELWTDHAEYSWMRAQRTYVITNSDTRVPTLSFLTWAAIVNTDLQKASQVQPDDKRIALAAAAAELFDDLSTVIANPSANGPREGFPVIPDDRRSSLIACMRRLEQLTHGPDKRVALLALKMKSIGAFLMQDTQEATADLQRALEIKPASDETWDALTALKMTVSPDELINLCQQRVAAIHSARSHIILAKAFVRQDRLRDAANEDRAALKLEPDSVDARVLQIALAIRQSTDDASLASINSLLQQVGGLLDKMPDDDQKSERKREVYLDTVLDYLLHSGADWQRTGKDQLDRFLRAYPNDETAQQIREAAQ